MALVVSGYMALDLGWRWIFWIMMAITGGWWILLVLTVHETRHTIILQQKAKRVQKLMRKENLTFAETVTDASVSGRKGLDELFKITLTRPFRFLFTEPITTFSAICNGFLYGLVYLFTGGLPTCFRKVLPSSAWPSARLWHPLQERYCLRRIKEHDGKGVPEERMWMARLSAILIPISLFWFGWTSCRSVHWIVPIIASALFGARIYIRHIEYPQLCCGQLSDLFRVGSGWRDPCEELGWRWVSFVRDADV
ncbi:polyamine transporter [Aspergillus nomiae NRRL 13137]|uniref:Polyamine transporter n=1 Tax=Aspergillus nomiae NRRL (strain ATCC 15546 / NRRL 13137 / CBS 260.88 / M93) TaxID=1509407 RepID=A0A0L1JHM6_ASPN3|nr:polyamine transporter [Aspergillus nomiae NRRL 13137]KNG91269.1 polyamine transporter [Aspergillus nomiae NRRL 13137]